MSGLCLRLCSQLPPCYAYPPRSPGHSSATPSWLPLPLLSHQLGSIVKLLGPSFHSSCKCFFVTDNFPECPIEIGQFLLFSFSISCFFLKYCLSSQHRIVFLFIRIYIFGIKAPLKSPNMRNLNDTTDMWILKKGTNELIEKQKQSWRCRKQTGLGEIEGNR